MGSRERAVIYDAIRWAHPDLQALRPNVLAAAAEKVERHLALLRGSQRLEARAGTPDSGVKAIDQDLLSGGGGPE